MSITYSADGKDVVDYQLERYEGKNVDVVAKTMTKLFPNHVINTVTIDAAVTMDFRLDRFRIYYDPKTSEVKEVLQG